MSEKLIEALKRQVAELGAENAMLKVEIAVGGGGGESSPTVDVAELYDRFVSSDHFVCRQWTKRFVGRLQQMNDTEPQAAKWAWDKLGARVSTLESMLGVNEQTELPRPDDPPQRYELPDGSKTNSCEQARAGWRNNCYGVQKSLREMFPNLGVSWDTDGSVEDFKAYVDGIAPAAPEVTKAQVTNMENTGQSPAEITAQMAQKALLENEPTR